MAIRIPLRTVATFNDDAELGGGSVAGGVAHPVQLLQDTDNVLVKFSASVKGTGVSALFQTTPDGGTTWYDVQRTSIVSNAVAGYSEEWLSVPVASAGINPIVKSTANAGSILGGTIGSAAASTLSQRQVSGLPIMSQQARVFIIINGDITSAAANSIRTTVMVNSQAAIS